MSSEPQNSGNAIPRSVPADIFVSYKREDEQLAKQLVEALKSQGLTVWWDPKIRAGQNFGTVIDQAIEAARCVVVLWSKRSIGSDWVKDEASVGKARGVLVPVSIDGVDPPLGFRQTHTAQLDAWDGDIENPEFQKLLGDLRELVHGDKARVPTSAPVVSARGRVLRPWTALAGLALFAFVAWSAHEVLKPSTAPRSDPNEPPIELSIAQGLYDEARALLEASLFLEDDRTDAIRKLESAVEANDEFTEAHLLLGEQLVLEADSLLGDKAEQRKLLMKARVHYRKAGAEEKTADVYLKLGELDNNCDVYENLNQQRPTPQSRYAAGNCSAAAGDYPVAESHFRNANEGVGLPEAKWGLAEVLRLSGQMVDDRNQRQAEIVSEVEDLYQSLMDEFPECADLHSAFGDALMESYDTMDPAPDWKDARDVFQDALDLDPESVALRVKLGWVNSKLWKFESPATLEKAERQLREAYEDAPNSVEAVIWLANALRQGATPEKIESAIELLDEAIRTSPENSRLYSSREQTYAHRLCADVYTKEVCDNRKESDRREKLLFASSSSSAPPSYRPWPCGAGPS